MLTKRYSHKRNYRWLIPWIVGLILLFLLLISVVLFLVTRNGSEEQVSEAIFATPIPTLTQVAVTQTPTPIPSPTPIPVGNIWVVNQPEIEEIEIEGVTYIVDVFVNENNPSVAIKAHCMQPKWPAPVVGDRYILSEQGVLVPCGYQNPCVTGDETSKLQRFQPMQ